MRITSNAGGTLRIFERTSESATDGITPHPIVNLRKMMMTKPSLKISVVGSHIFLKNTKYSDRSKWAVIPGGIWLKKKQAWQYKKSPFTAFRIKYYADKCGQNITPDAGFNQLLYDMKHIRSAAHYGKGPDALKSAEKNINTAFDTTTIPWAHQVVAAEFSRGRNMVYLAMDMGTGKTLVGINEIHQTKAQLVLVICPKTVMDVWIDEFEKHKPSHHRRICVLDYGSSTKKAELFNQFIVHVGKNPSVVIINYESFWRGDLGAALLDTDFDIIIYDEIHKLKAPGSQCSRFAARLWSRASFRMGLSGTPFPSGHKIDVYGQYRALDPGVFGTNFSRFRSRYWNVLDGDYPILIGTKNEEEFDKLLGLTMFRVEKSDVMDLPETIMVNRYFRLDISERRIYEDMESDFVAFVGTGKATATNALAKIVRLQQITSGFVKTEMGIEEFVGESKRKALTDILRDEIPPGEPCVVFCKFTSDLAFVRQISTKLGLKYKELSGAHKQLEKGQYPANTDILGVQVRTGGLGVNLVKSAYCIFYSIGYSLAEYLQCRDRLHRGGQSRQVLYINLIAKDTIDVIIHDAISQKKEIVDAILEKIRKDIN